MNTDKEGLRGMFKGWWITLFREVPQFGIYFGTYAWLRLQLSQLTGTPPEELERIVIIGTVALLIKYTHDISDRLYKINKVITIQVSG
jgi:heme/copper-type cytochrome/quinol oxidase subunit 3